ncbi:MAG: single-stranded-DNA-specific exonuclease RecJ [bacterium]|nr:single-stranded-DNA-specific exonuclease RecJ [bacterium]
MKRRIGKSIKSIEGPEQIIEILLENRGINTKKGREEFFDPPKPEEISVKEVGISDSQLQKAVSRIEEAIKNKEKIIVYGDYDVDGICAAGILWETLHFLGAHALPYLPDRFSEGYGLNVDAIKKLKDEDSDLGLIITVDHGITAHEKVDFAKGIGVDVIITDHHEPGKTLPAAYAIIHTTKISGSAVAWILSRELIKNWKLEIGNWKFIDDHLGLAALGTIADVLPLLGPNRSIVKHGLGILRKTTRPGIDALCREAGVKQEEIDTFHIGFILAPRLNSMGRIEHAISSLRLLCTRSRGRAEELAFRLGRTNKTRQEKTEEASLHINENFAKAWNNGSLPKLLFVHHESYEEGVVGIVAGRLVERYHRPAIVISQGEEFSKASARSISGVNIIEIIREAGEEFFVSVGGHPMAAGFTTKTKDLVHLGQRFKEVSDKIEDGAFIKKTRVDCEIDFSAISGELYQELARFAPFGLGNPEPVFLTKGVTVHHARLVGRDQKHLKLTLRENKNQLEGIAFRMGELYQKLSSDRPVDIVYSVEENDWNGNTRLQLKVKDISGYD